MTFLMATLVCMSPLTQKHYGFKPGDSYINHLLPISHEIYKSLDDGFEV